MGNLVVQKYGGMCLSSPEKIVATAKKIARRVQHGDQIIVIVSAMGKSTDELIRLAYQVSPHPQRRELDMFLSTGERISMSLLTMALIDLGVKAISFTGSQAGVFTNHSHSNAKIVDIKAHRIEEELKKGKVVVLAGFQGVDPTTKEITTLGRGGSDTTAVAMAAAFKVHCCEIIKEVEGLCSADPKIISYPKIYPKINYNEILEMCFWGAKVLHYRSVELAKMRKVPLEIHFANNTFNKTLVHGEKSMFENEKVLAINSHTEVHHLEVGNVENLAQGFKEMESFLAQTQLAWPQILASALEGNTLKIMYTSDLEHLGAMAHGLQKHPICKIHRPPLSSISLTCHGSVGSDLWRKIPQALAENNIPVLKILSSPLTLTLLVAPEHRELSIKQLHEKFIS